MRYAIAHSVVHVMALRGATVVHAMAFLKAVNHPWRAPWGLVVHHHDKVYGTFHSSPTEQLQPWSAP